MKYFPNVIFFLMSLATLTACGTSAMNPVAANLPAIDVPSGEDGAVVHARALYTISSEQQSAVAKLLNNFWMPKAYAASGATTVTYTNSGSTNFSLNVSGFSPSGFSGNTLSLGSVALAGISDNNLKVCGTNNNTRCSQAVIRVYTTGSVSGFVNTADAYGVPLYTGTLNPSSPVGLLAAGSVQVQTLTIPSTKRTVSLADFPSPSYPVSADFSNGGAGSYSMSYVVEYALLP